MKIKSKKLLELYAMGYSTIEISILIDEIKKLGGKK